MWKRNEPDYSSDTAVDAPPEMAGRAASSTSGSSRSSRSAGSRRAGAPNGSSDPQPTGTSAGVAKIGQSVVVKGELTGSENLVIEGTIEGTINLHQHQLTVGPGGQITAQISAKAVVVLGRVDGNITATEKIDIRENGSVEGDITAPRVSIAEGSHFRGSIDMQQAQKPGNSGS